LLGRVERSYSTVGDCEPRERLVKLAGIQDTGHAQCTSEDAPTRRKREASRIGMQMDSPTRPSARRVGHKGENLTFALFRDDSQQLTGWRTLPATHTSAYRPRTPYH
jgi:hypothetical protein